MGGRSTGGPARGGVRCHPDRWSVEWSSTQRAVEWSALASHGASAHGPYSEVNVTVALAPSMGWRPVDVSRSGLALANGREDLLDGGILSRQMCLDLLGFFQDSSCIVVCGLSPSISRSGLDVLTHDDDRQQYELEELRREPEHRTVALCALIVDGRLTNARRANK